ncbi:hypothetical protein UCRPC4_g01088 [Phaeomoniella chlamydospora]|uniref:Uncharacterized protein n=1 Tax=Phaeomoniella chlamydospora TaxID=158046 RepID=A0A0G2GW91_PHACM|nr:hypothetical protein UCRPC4_g01088 [Phaeomoniella chlamydospora]
MKSEGAVQVGGGNGATWLDTWWTVLIARIQGRYRPTTRIITVVTLALFLSIYSLRSFDPVTLPSSISPQEQTVPSRHNFLHLLTPATKSDVNLCKTILSASVLNYSTPTLINWGKRFTEDGLSNGGAHLFKISGILNYLNEVGPEGNDDLIVIVDGYDTWFQLGPDVLLSRYNSINRQANDRIFKRLCRSRSCPFDPFSHISQHILFSSQKKCWPHSPDELACHAAPASTLPEDVYGPETDVPYPDDENPFLRTRGRYLNSGFAIGPVKAMRRVFEEAERRMKIDDHAGSDQGVLSDIFATQEYAREILRRKYYAEHPTQRFFLGLSTFVFGRSSFDRDREAVLQPSATKEVLALDESSLTSIQSLDYGIGLDYTSELSHVTVFAQRDADWITYPPSSSTPSRYWNILPMNIKSLPPTFTSFIPPPPLPNVTTWDNIPLYTNLFTKTIPLSVHHNAWQRNMKDLRQKMWGQMWWNPQAFELLAAHAVGPRVPIVSEEIEGDEQISRIERAPMTRTSKTTNIKEYWSPVENKGGARADNGTWIEWDDLCGKWAEELFDFSDSSEN